MLRHSEDEPSVPAGTTQKPSKADGEEHFDAEAGLPDPDQVMGQVPETMKREEKRGSFMNGLKVDWSKMNLFKQGQNKPTGGSVLIEDDGGEESENTRKVEAQVPGVIDEQEHSVEVDDGMAKEEPVDENVHGSTATAGQRKDLEVKIVREIVRVLSGGKSHLLLRAQSSIIHKPSSFAKADSSIPSRRIFHITCNTSETSSVAGHKRPVFFRPFFNQELAIGLHWIWLPVPHLPVEI
jgi:hypothetical protein